MKHEFVLSFGKDTSPRLLRKFCAKADELGLCEANQLYQLLSSEHPEFKTLTGITLENSHKLMEWLETETHRANL